MEGINSYWRQLSADDMTAGRHRDMVGGMWEEVGSLQVDFLKRQGLLPGHRLLDVGCGCLRGGIHFIRYLNTGNYYGLDINPSLLAAGELELSATGLLDKNPVLLVNDKFECSRFGVKFAFALGLSVFTHLFMNHIARCLLEVKKVLQADGRFYATFFQAPSPVYLTPILHHPGEITTHYDSDPFHYSYEEMSMLAESVGFVIERIDDWQHPRAQKMLCFRNAA